MYYIKGRSGAFNLSTATDKETAIDLFSKITGHTYDGDKPLVVATRGGGAVGIYSDYDYHTNAVADSINNHDGHWIYAEMESGQIHIKDFSKFWDSQLNMIMKHRQAIATPIANVIGFYLNYRHVSSTGQIMHSFVTPLDLEDTQYATKAVAWKIPRFDSHPRYGNSWWAKIYDGALPKEYAEDPYRENTYETTRGITRTNDNPRSLDWMTDLPIDDYILAFKPATGGQWFWGKGKHIYPRPDAVGCTLIWGKPRSRRREHLFSEELIA